MNLKLSILFTVFVSIANQLFAVEPSSAPCPSLAMSGSSVSCYGNSNGSAQVAISSGSGNYSITWSNGVTTTSNPGLAVGTYTVNVKDNVSGCSVNGAYVVGSLDPISISSTITNVDCFGNSSGSIDVTVISGSGTAPYTFGWVNSLNNSVGSSEDLTSSPSGTFTQTITDFKGCTKVTSFTITQPAEALNSSVVKTDVSCFAGANGGLDISVWGGTNPYNYSWGTGQLTQDVNSLTAGNYSVTITDNHGCSRVQNYSISQPTVLGGTSSKTDVACYGQATGNASLSATGGTSPYSFSWSNSSTLFSTTSSFLGNIVADSYNVTVTDANNCQYTSSLTINQPTQLTGGIVITNVSCNGGSNGAIDLTVAGGTFPYTYQWTNNVPASISTSQDLSNVVAQTYTVVVLDAYSCSISLTGEITQPALPITVSESHINVLCYGNNTGSIDLSVIGGTSPYTYSWTSGQTSQNISNLLSGTYGYTVTDNLGCTSVSSIYITQPSAPLAVTNSIIDANCFGDANGIIDLTVSGGTSPYSYAWSNSTYLLSTTSQDLTNFPADTYTYTARDANGCLSTSSLIIAQPTQLQTSISGVNILCKGGNNGSVDLTITGGVLPYNYSWNNGYTTEDLSSMLAGVYSVVVADAHNCIITNQIELTEPMDSLSYTFTERDVKCNDGTDGNISITVEGGTVPYSYLWSNANTNSEITDLTAGMYHFVVTDFNGCLLLDSIYVDQPAPLTLNELITPVTCFGLSNGIIDLSPIGGTAPYTYTWYNSEYALSAQTQDLIGYPADTFQVEIIDTNNCFYEMFFAIPQPAILAVTYNSNIASCSGSSDANIDVTITGGNPTYSSNWSNGATTEDLLNISADTYNLMVTDQKNCKDSLTVVIAQPDSIKMHFEMVEVSCIDQHDGIAITSPYGGNGGYSYLWSNSVTTAQADSLYNQWYSVVVTDVIGCSGKDSIFITKNNQSCITPVQAFTPNGDNYNDRWVIDNLYLYANAEMKIFNRWGNLIHTHKGVYEPWDGKIHGNEAPSDVYYYILNLNTPDREPITGNITIVR